MKILFTLPHYYKAQPGGKYGSSTPDPKRRVHALASCLSALHETFGNQQRMLDIGRRLAVPANQIQRHDIDVVVCTTGTDHVLDQLPLPATLFVHHATQAEPMMLGFECHSVLRDAIGRYDYYGYLEDDLVLRDSWFFAKLAWFVERTGPEHLLQPNRFEVAAQAAVHKVYVDGDLAARVTARFRDLERLNPIHLDAFGVPLCFRPALNPHAGCFFLSADQMRAWTSKPWFLDRDVSFIGPLESAATLGVLKTFNVYKPSYEHAGFVEVQHCGRQFLTLAGTQLPLAEK